MVGNSTPASSQAPSSGKDSSCYLGIDVGGTNTKIGLVDGQGNRVAYRSIETQEELGPQSAMERIAATCEELIRESGVPPTRVMAAGLATPGTMDVPGGMILEPPNMPHWRHYPVRDKLAELLQRPVAFLNDGNAAAFGEFWIGSGRDYGSMIMLTLGTGVGGGIIVEGKLIHGVNSFGSECGHLVVDPSPEARPCVWGGGFGELEAYASASAVAKWTRDQLEQGAESVLQDRLKKNQAITALAVYEAARTGDAFALGVIDETARYLGVAIVSFVHMIDPGLVLLGGAMDFGGPDCEVGRRFRQGIREEFRRRAFHVVQDRTTIEFASLGGDAGFIGAAGFARQAYLESASVAES